MPTIYFNTVILPILGKKMRWVMINTYVWFFIFLVPLIYSAIEFFRTEEIQYQIMYAPIFICCWLSIGILKVFAWVMIQRVGIRREIKRLEIHLATKL